MTNAFLKHPIKRLEKGGDGAGDDDCSDGDDVYNDGDKDVDDGIYNDCDYS